MPCLPRCVRLIVKVQDADLIAHALILLDKIKVTGKATWQTAEAAAPHPSHLLGMMLHKVPLQHVAVERQPEIALC